MMVYNQYNPFAADQWNVLICTVGLGCIVGWGIFENGSVESDSMDRSDVNDSV